VPRCLKPYGAGAFAYLLGLLAQLRVTDHILHVAKAVGEVPIPTAGQRIHVVDAAAIAAPGDLQRIGNRSAVETAIGILLVVAILRSTAGDSAAQSGAATRCAAAATACWPLLTFR
jgi:hypothetical protein